MKPFIGLAFITLGACIVAAALLTYLTNHDASYLKDYGGIAAGVILLGLLITKSGVLEEETNLKAARLELLKLLSEGVPEDKAIHQISDRFPYSEETIKEWNNEINMTIADLQAITKDND